VTENNVILQHNYYEERRTFGRIRRVPDGTGFLHVDLDGIIRSAVIPAEIFPAVSNAVIALQRQITELRAQLDDARRDFEATIRYDGIKDMTSEQVDQILKAIKETHRG
jgi:hypothetical protein